MIWDGFYHLFCVAIHLFIKTDFTGTCKANFVVWADWVVLPVTASFTFAWKWNRAGIFILVNWNYADHIKLFDNLVQLSWLSLTAEADVGVFGRTKRHENKRTQKSHFKLFF